MELFSGKGGANLWAMIESLKNTVGEENFNKMIKRIWKNTHSDKVAN